MRFVPHRILPDLIVGAGLPANRSHAANCPNARMFAAKAAPTDRGEREACSLAHARDILSDPSEIEHMRAASRERHGAMFTWEKVLGEHEGLLEAGSRGKVQGSS
jgi:hypothetical protein